jgi:hypothetical protein
MKLELKHLAPYLPYELNGIVEYSEDDKQIIKLHTEDGQNNVVGIADWFRGYTCKPILRPLSDLTKEIEVNGEKFVPIVELAKKNSYYGINEVKKVFVSADCYCVRYLDNKNIERQFEYCNGENKNFFIYCVWNELRCDCYNVLSLYQYLLEQHFDIFGLIEKGLAIDINSLPQSSE